MPPEEAELREPEKTPIQPQDAYYLGHTLSFVSTATHRPSIFALGGGPDEEDYIIDALEMAVDILDHSTGSYSAHISIERTVNRFYSSYELDESTEPVFLDDEDARMLNERTNEWVDTISRELEQRTSVSVESTGLFDIKKAMEAPANLFDQRSTWESLPDDVQSDISESCRSLATGCPTASVFLSLRAVEQQLHEWYVQETGNEIKDRTFGQVLGELDDQYNSSSPPRVLDHLNFLVDRRNEVAHAEKSSNTAEAENTLMLTRTTIAYIRQQLDSMSG